MDEFYTTKPEEFELYSNGKEVYINSAKRMADYISETLVSISPTIAKQVQVFSVKSWSGVWGGEVSSNVDTLSNCLNGEVPLSDMMAFPFFLKFEPHYQTYYVHIRCNTLEQFYHLRRELIEAVYLFVPYGLDMDGIEPESVRILRESEAFDGKNKAKKRAKLLSLFKGNTLGAYREYTDLLADYIRKDIETILKYNAHQIELICATKGYDIEGFMSECIDDDLSFREVVESPFFLQFDSEEVYRPVNVHLNYDGNIKTVIEALSQFVPYGLVGLNVDGVDGANVKDDEADEDYEDDDDGTL